MKIPEPVLELIYDEQGRQRGNFVPDDSGYLEKLSKYAELFVHQDSSGITGFVFFYCNAPDKAFSYITLIASASHVRGTGVGYLLLKHVLDVSKEKGFLSCRLEVRKENKKALDFYRRAGFFCLEDRAEKFLMSISLNK